MSYLDVGSSAGTKLTQLTIHSIGKYEQSDASIINAVIGTPDRDGRLGKYMRPMQGWKQWGAVAVSGLLQAVAFPLAGPVPIWRRCFCWICLVPLLVVLTATTEKKLLSQRKCFFWSYGCGVIWYLTNCYWIYQTMYLYGDLPRAAALGILFLFSLYLGLYHGLFGVLTGFLRRRFGVEMALAVAPVSWVAVELARGRITGFPWDLLGYTQVDNSVLTRLAPLAGVYGLSLVIAAVNAGVAAGFAPGLPQNRGRRLWLAGVSIGAAVCLQIAGARAGDGDVSSPADQKAVMLQQNLPVGAEAAGRQENYENMLGDFERLSGSPGYVTESRGAASSEKFKPTVILWPESPSPFQWDDPRFISGLQQVALAADAPIIADAVKYEQSGLERHYFNTAQLVSPSGQLSGRYDKVHLVPFGEYVPFKDAFFFAKNLTQQVGDFSRGAQRTPLRADGHSYGTFICYESIFGDEVRQFARQGAQVLVNLSDDGWYGDTSAPWEHLDMVRMRAIENHRWVLRATNTGVTGAVDPQGRLHAQAPRHKRLAVAASFRFEEGTTFYTRHGDWIAYICAAICVALVLWGMLRRGEAEVH